LEQILWDARGKEAFQKFLKERQSENLLEFWESVEERRFKSKEGRIKLDSEEEEANFRNEIASDIGAPLKISIFSVEFATIRKNPKWRNSETEKFLDCKILSEKGSDGKIEEKFGEKVQEVGEEVEKFEIEKKKELEAEMDAEMEKLQSETEKKEPEEKT